MEFFMDNYYIWIIIAIVIILMTIIGYIAEKTDFGKKEFSKRNKPVKENGKKKEEIEEVPIEPKRIVEKDVVEFSEPLADDMKISNEKKDYKREESFVREEEKVPTREKRVVEERRTPVEEDLNVPFGDSNRRMSVAEETIDELSAPLVDKSPVIKRIEEDLNAPFGDETKKRSEKLDLPDIDSVKEDVRYDSNEAEDDIWKF